MKTPYLSPFVVGLFLMTMQTSSIALAQEVESTLPEDSLADLSDYSDMQTEQDEQEDLEQAAGQRRTPLRPSRLSVNSTVKFSVKKKLTPDVTLDVSARVGYGGLESPNRPRNSSLGGGLVLSWKLGKYALSAGIEGANGYKNYLENYNSNNLTVRQGIARSFALGSSFSVTPAAAVSYVFSTDTRQNRYKVDMSAPLSWKVGNIEFQPVLPRLSYQSYSNQDRRDWTTFIGSGINWAALSSATLSASIGYERKTSNNVKAEYSRWVLAPQVAFKLPF
jgi:hypothetical protein